MSPTFEIAFHHLLSAWNREYELRHRGAAATEVYRASCDLDRARFDAWRAANIH